MEEEVFIARYGLGKSRNGLARRRILEVIQESGKRGLSVYELSWLTRADVFFVLKVLKQLKRADLISVKANYAVHWCSGRWRNG